MLFSWFQKREKSNFPPIFVRGVSRSGGTLLVTLLDAHPEIAMSYELYPTLLAGELETSGDIVLKPEYQGGGTQKRKPVNLKWLLDLLSGVKDTKQALKQIEDKNLRAFVARCNRGGLTNKDLVTLLKQHIGDAMDFKTIGHQLRFVERCCLRKMTLQNKQRWGLKCSGQFEDYLNVWPKAYFLNIIRDGRDVLASQLNTGNFTDPPEQVGLGWANTHQEFRRLVNTAGVNAHEVFYEKLVEDPEPEVRKICDFLGIPFDRAMLNFYEQDLTIFKASHLSMERISKPIDTSKIGRWKTDLTPEQLERFYSTAQDAMEEFGYLEKAYAH